MIAKLNHVIDSLDLYRAKLARFPCLLCGDVSDPGHLEILLPDDQQTQSRAERFVGFMSYSRHGLRIIALAWCASFGKPELPWRYTVSCYRR